MNCIMKAIANAKIPVSFQVWVIRNLIITAFAVLCIYLHLSVHPSSSNYLMAAMAIGAIFVAWKA